MVADRESIEQEKVERSKKKSQKLSKSVQKRLEAQKGKMIKRPVYHKYYGCGKLAGYSLIPEGQNIKSTYDFIYSDGSHPSRDGLVCESCSSLFETEYFPPDRDCVFKNPLSDLTSWDDYKNNKYGVILNLVTFQHPWEDGSFRTTESPGTPVAGGKIISPPLGPRIFVPDETMMDNEGEALMEPAR